MPKTATTNPLSFLKYTIHYEQNLRMNANQIKCDTGTGEAGRNNFIVDVDESLINGSPLPIRFLSLFYNPTPTRISYPIQHETPENMDAERRRCQVPIAKYQDKKKYSGNMLSNSERQKTSAHTFTLMEH